MSNQNKKIESNFAIAKEWMSMRKKKQQESLSGPGSSKVNASDAVTFLNRVIAKYKPKTILDLGCGDFNWAQNLKLAGIAYQGWDCDKEMITSLNKKYGNHLIKFYTKDIINESFPNVDLIICRDVLFHLQPFQALHVINKAKSSAKLFASTSFRGVEKNTKPQAYNDIKGWGVYKNNLNIKPFNLKSCEIDYADETMISIKGQIRSICLYRFNQ